MAEFKLGIAIEGINVLKNKISSFAQLLLLRAGIFSNGIMEIPGPSNFSNKISVYEFDLFHSGHIKCQ